MSTNGCFDTTDEAHKRLCPLLTLQRLTASNGVVRVCVYVCVCRGVHVIYPFEVCIGMFKETIQTDTQLMKQTGEYRVCDCVCVSSADDLKTCSLHYFLEHLVTSLP